MSAPTTSELLAEFDRLEKLLRTCAEDSIDRRAAFLRLGEITEEFGRRTNAALGSAFSAVLLGTSASDAKLAMSLGDRLRVELRNRGLEVLAVGDLPPV